MHIPPCQYPVARGRRDLQPLQHAHRGGVAIQGPFDGEESITLVADLDAGATGTMPSDLPSDLIEPVLELAREADPRAPCWGK